MSITKKLLVGITTLILSSLAYAEMVKTEVNGYSVDYYIPDVSKVQVPENMEMYLKVLIDDPTPLPQDYRPIRASALSTAEKTTSTTFTIDYIARGGTDLWDEPCYTFPGGAKIIFEAAAKIWANNLETSVPITIQACWGNFSGSTLGYSGGYSAWNFPNVPLFNTKYDISLANSFNSSDLFPNKYDMYITYNSAFAWYYGTDGNTPGDKHDLLTVVLHEIAHGLNFSGNMSYGSTYCSGVNYGCWKTHPGVWDRLIVFGSGISLLHTANDSSAMGNALTSGNLYFNGPKAKAAYGGNKVKIYTPSTWRSGSSYSHVDYDTFNDTSNQLMVWAISKGEAIHNPGNMTFGMLEDMGWNVVPGVVMAPIISYLLE